MSTEIVNIKYTEGGQQHGAVFRLKVIKTRGAHAYGFVTQIKHYGAFHQEYTQHGLIESLGPIRVQAKLTGKERGTTGQVLKAHLLNHLLRAGLNIVD